MILVNLKPLRILILSSIIYSILTISAHKTSPLTSQSNLNSFPPIQQRLIKLLSDESTNQDMILKAFQNAGLLQIFSKIPENLKEAIIQQYSSGLLSPLPEGFNISSSFINWGETISTEYSNIFYPTDYSPYAGQQISKIQEFVRKGVENGKRVRGSANRHSWSSVFSDPGQLLVSFYPFQIAEGTAETSDAYFSQMDNLEEDLSSQNIEHLNEIRKVGELEEKIIKQGQQTTIKKHLIKIGAGVNNGQLRKWSKKHGYQIKSNTLIMDIGFIGGLCTCSHGGGKDAQTVADYVYAIEFIDYKGNRQIISKADQPQLIKSAASSMGLLGLIIFVTVEMEDLQIVKLQSVIGFKDLVIPWPKDYQGKEKRLQRSEWKEWKATTKPSAIDLDWDNNVKIFKEALNQTFNQWIFLSDKPSIISAALFQVYGQKTKESLQKLYQQGEDFIEQYPPAINATIDNFQYLLFSQIQQNQQSSQDKQSHQHVITALLKNPFDQSKEKKIKQAHQEPSNYHLLPLTHQKQANLVSDGKYVNYPDAVHYLRGVHNFKEKCLEVQINIPIVNNSGVLQPDYDLIQKMWWVGLQFFENNQDAFNKGFEMRFFKGSNATLAPTKGYDYVCSIECVFVLTHQTAQVNKQYQMIISLFNAWKSLKDSNGNPVTIRVHWGKLWDILPVIKQHILNDESLKQNIRQFIADYKEIAELKGFDYMKNLEAFSNQLYRELLNNAMQRDEQKIK